MLNINGLIGKPPAERHGELMSYIIDFVYNNLPLWRTTLNNSRNCAENELTGKLSDYLSSICSGNELFYFRIEEKQSGRCKIDMSAKPTQLLLPYLYNNDLYFPLTVFEAKRLPAPEKSRLKEYLTGGTEMSGGVQRFKSCVHGKDYDVAAMIGYIQKETSEFHFNQLNIWIDEFATCSPDGLPWFSCEKLKNFSSNNPEKTSRAISEHSRISTNKISLHHLWVELN